MLRITPDVSPSPPQESYRFYDHRGLPFVGEQSLMRQDEYRSQTVMVARSGYGNFDTAQPEQQHFGRTLYEVMVKASTGEYRIVAHREQWVRCDKFGVRVLQYIQWLEYSDRMARESVKTASRNPIKDTFTQG